MAKKLSKLQLAQQKAEAAAKKTNQKINELGIHTSDLYAALAGIQASFDCIRNVPEENRLTYEKLKAIRVKWKQQAENIVLEYKKQRLRLPDNVQLVSVQVLLLLHLVQLLLWALQQHSVLHLQERLFPL